MRKVDHAIKLLANTSPIAKPPYRHSLAQSVELDNQLNDLLSKEYISLANHLGELLSFLLKK